MIVSLEGTIFEEFKGGAICNSTTKLSTLTFIAGACKLVVALRWTGRCRIGVSIPVMMMREVVGYLSGVSGVGVEADSLFVG